jgi:uncharacterized membrane protein
MFHTHEYRGALPATKQDFGGQLDADDRNDNQRNSDHDHPQDDSFHHHACLGPAGRRGARHMALVQATAVQAQDNEKCYGIAKAGKNDCQFSSGSCAGTAPTDALKDTWIYVPAGTCEKIVGGSLTPA